MAIFREIRLNDIKNALSSPSVEISLGRGDFPHTSQREVYHARPALLTVFSITQSDLSITQMRIPTDLETSHSNDSKIDMNSIHL
jgi:hypothetical protein